MYEDQTQDAILTRMLGNVSDSIDKREGSVIYDALAPTSIEAYLLYAMCDYFLKNTFGDTADREYLIERAKERGLEPYAATNAIVKGVFTPSDAEVTIGARFSYGAESNFVVVERLAAGEYLLKCETPGTIGNVPAGQLLPIDYMPGLSTAAVVEVTIPGEDEEETEAFRARYLASFKSQAYGGNIADYKEKVNKIQGVGGVKVYPVWNGGGTVRIAFMTSEYGPPTAEFIDEVQTILDPVTNSGEGVGVAPIGHSVTVQGAQNSAIEIGLHLTLSSGVFADYLPQIEAVLDEYFLSLNKNWEYTQVATPDEVSNTGLVVRISQIESRLLNIDGIVDIVDTTLNGVAGNLTLGVDELAMRGAVIDADS